MKSFVVRDVDVRRRVGVLTFSAVTVLQAGAAPEASLGEAVALSTAVALLAAAVTLLYHMFLNHLADELAERRNQKMTALAIDD